jgi:hypothetical protein
MQTLDDFETKTGRVNPYRVFEEYFNYVFNVHHTSWVTFDHVLEMYNKYVLLNGITIREDERLTEELLEEYIPLLPIGMMATDRFGGKVLLGYEADDVAHWDIMGEWKERWREFPISKMEEACLKMLFGD